MVLPNGLERSFWAELKTDEEARQVPYITSVERIGFDRGWEEGRQEAGKLRLQRILVGNFGTLPDRLTVAVEELSSEAVDSLAILHRRGFAIALLKFSTLQDLETWLAQH